MSFPKYYATYCTIGGEGGANPFWHSFLLLSTQADEKDPIIVDDAIGFYSQPSSTTNPIIKGLKYLIGFPVDLQNGHGVLIHEHMRDLDGNGLRGISFETTDEKYNRLKTLYTEKMALEATAIAELNTSLQQQHSAQNGVTRFSKEKSLAEVEGREPRLRPFHISIKLSRNGLDTTASYTCKNYALDLLVETGITDEAMRRKLTGGTNKHAFPRTSDMSLPSLRLVSTGKPATEISSRSQRAYHNRKWNANRLFWATAPYVHDVGAPEITPATNQYQHQYQSIRDTLNRARKLELILLQKISELENTADSEAKRKAQLEEQLQRVQSLYTTFENAYQNHLPNCLSNKLLHAETTLNVATMMLTPHKANYSFILRAYESIAIRNIALALLTMFVAAAAFPTGPLSAVVITASTLFAGQQLYGFFKEETQFAKMRADYRGFQTSSERSPEMGSVPTFGDPSLRSG